MLGVAPIGLTWRLGSLSAVLVNLKGYFSFKGALSIALGLSSVAYLYVQDCHRVLQVEMQKERITLQQLYDEQYQLLLEKQILASRKQLGAGFSSVNTGDHKTVREMHFPSRSETVRIAG